MEKLEVILAETRRRQSTDEFKSEAVRLTRKAGHSVAQVARELGISDSVLYRWMNEQRHAESQDSTRQAVRVGQEELTRLKREKETLTQERDFVRRATAFFAKESR
jgi:transposase